MVNKYGIAAKHNKSYETWSNVTRVDRPYIVAASDNTHYEAWDRLLKFDDGGTLVAARDNHDYDPWDELGVLDGTNLLAGKDLSEFRRNKKKNSPY